MWEWCADWFAEDHYRNSPLDDPKGPAPAMESCRVLRGGSWLTPARYCRSAIRFEPGFHFSHLGFRVSLVLADK
ncbi:MAG: formylglycine-generating enzyme family protein [Thermoguttaceae bacterium]